eukprot:8983551-Ditylum_brightwellii.AAC.1
MGLCKAAGFCQMNEKKIELPENSLFTHFSRCSGAASLVDTEHWHATKMGWLNMLMQGPDAKQKAAEM